MNTVYKLFKRLFSYTRLNAKLGFGETPFVITIASNYPVNTQHLYNICTMLDQRRRCCADILQAFCVCWVAYSES